MVLDFPFSLIAASALSFFLSFISIAWLIRKKAGWALDQPNARSLHTVPVSRIGGLGLLFAVIATWVCFSAPLPLTVLSGAGVLMVISLIDDIRQTPVWCRLLVHGIAAAGFSLTFLLETGDWVTAWMMMLAIVWMSNLYNFMDGSDGLAGGMAVIGFGCYGWIALSAGDNNFALINFTVAAAAMAFLLHNFHPARIFMGDGGSVPLGFLAAVIGILGWIQHVWTLWVPLLIFSPFIVDATVTLIKRLLRGEKIWQAHREHYYQRLVQSGFGHRNTALSAYVIMLMTGTTAVWMNGQDTMAQSRIVMIWGGIYLVLMLIADQGRKFYSDRG